MRLWQWHWWRCWCSIIYTTWALCQRNVSWNNYIFFRFIDAQMSGIHILSRNAPASAHHLKDIVVEFEDQMFWLKWRNLSSLSHFMMTKIFCWEFYKSIQMMAVLGIHFEVERWFCLCKIVVNKLHISNNSTKSLLSTLI